MLLEQKTKAGRFFPLFAESLFCDLSPYSLKSLAEIKQKVRFPKNAEVFWAGDVPCGIHILLEGQATLRVSKLHIAHRVAPGEILGLTETIANLPYEMNLETITDCVFERIESQALFRFLNNDAEVCFRLVKLLGSNIQQSYQRFAHQ